MKTIAAVTFSFIAIATAAPAQSLEIREPGSVQICTGENYTGECTTLKPEFNECQKLDAPFLKNVGSFKPDAGAFCRITYTADSCTTHGDAFIDPTPGAPTLHHFKDPATGDVIDAGSKMTSFLCQECTGCS